eukprot:NODE_7903_length_433_cov_50.822917_g7044_i0.p2 GENE.NODE_7903_length_433_cov_50.822917_g7044_i0~~NODE_7903_length_433_cov_50.822917_g7044_i0.p2  ORF type:complete len:102 (+),score=22.53 NODE_7903_length_433_cov_50.822917_g7044_i0:32-307(+)
MGRWGRNKYVLHSNMAGNAVLRCRCGVEEPAMKWESTGQSIQMYCGQCTRTTVWTVVGSTRLSSHYPPPLDVSPPRMSPSGVHYLRAPPHR